jgi:hypothetical protein
LAPRLNYRNEVNDQKENFLDYYHRVSDMIKNLFPHRTYTFFGLTEWNEISPWSSFLRPINPQDFFDDIFRTLGDSVSQESSCPFNLVDKEKFVVAAELSHKIASIPFKSTFGDLRKIHFGDQIDSPATWITGGSGSYLEHAILMCDFFLGLGLDAYLAFGKGNPNK